MLCVFVYFNLLFLNPVLGDCIKYAMQGDISYFFDGSKYGVMNRAEHIVIPARFDEVEPLYSGFAIVFEDGKGGVINDKGEIVIEPQWDYIVHSDSFTDDKLFIMSIENKYGVIDTNNLIIIPPIFDGIKGFANGKAKFVSKGYYGLISDAGEILIEPEWGWTWFYPLYDDDKGIIYYESDGFIAGNKNGMDGWFSKDGCEIFNPLFDRTWPFNDQRAVFMQDYLFGVVNMTGTIVVDAYWDNAAEIYEEGYLAVCKNDKMGFIDVYGNIVIPIVFDMPYFIDMCNFSNGLAMIKTGELYGYINHNGEIIIDAQYTEAYKFNSGSAIVLTNSGWQVINTLGQPIHNDFFQDAKSSSEGLTPVCMDDLWGYLSVEGHLVIPYQYDDAYWFRNGTALIYSDEDEDENSPFYTYFINQKGERICPYWDTHEFDNQGW